MSLYTIRLDQFHIRNTRSYENDTIVVSMTVVIGSETFTFSRRMGDISNGNFNLSDSHNTFEVPLVSIESPDTIISLEFAIVNAGHNAGEVERQLQTALDSIAGGVAGREGTTGVVAAVAIEVVNVALTPLFANCDGTVAADFLQAKRSDFDNLISSNMRTITHTKNYPGSDSPTGCGSNSNYDVTWTFIRSEVGDSNQPDPNTAFIILSRSSGLVLDVTGDLRTDGAQLQQFPENGGDNQHWQLIPVAGGFFQIRSRSSGLNLDVPSSTHANGAIIQQFHDNGTAAQEWTFEPVPVPPPNLIFPIAICTFRNFITAELAVFPGILRVLASFCVPASPPCKGINAMRPWISRHF